ncbi:hypothetical protein GALL_511900 [mine drainage metagenome]|uniref:Uncharacterized protein n=1 Tax=mine drainage metagenome TaxID=410659 RepID=A0A1J5P7P3_9ZZZZ
MLVDDDAEHHGIVPRDDAAVEFGRARVDRDRVTLRGIADFLNALLEQHLQDRAAIVGCAADQEIVGGLAPILLEPFDVGLETAGSCNKRRSGDGGAATALLQRGRQKHAVGDFQIEDFRVVEDLDAKLLGGQIERVQHRPAAAEEERVGPAEAERAAERRLPAHALFDDPVQDVLGLPDHVARKLLVGLAAGDAEQVFPEFLLGIGPGEDLGRRIMGAAHVAGVAGVAAAIELRRALKHQHGGAVAPCGDRGAQRGVAAANHQHVVFMG